MKKLLVILGSIGIIASGASSVMAMSLNIKQNEDKKEIEVSDNATILVGGALWYGIVNDEELTNLQAISLDDKIATASITTDGSVNVKGISEGIVQVVVSADNAFDKIMTITVYQAIPINVVKKISMKAQETIYAKITNFKYLVDVKSLSDNDDIVTTSIVGDSVKITGLKSGTTEVRVYSENSRGAVISVTVGQDKKEIEVSDNSHLLVGWTLQSIVDNSEELTNLQAISLDDKIATAWTTPESVFVEGISEGTVQILVTADNAFDKIMTITVYQSIPFKVIEKVNMKAQETIYAKIINFKDLINVHSQSENQEILTTSIVGDSIKITGLKRGTTEVLVWADNSKGTTIAVTVF